MICYIDDILITGKMEKEHLDNLAAMLQKLQEHGLHVKKEKCEFMISCVEYLGHKIDAEGLHALDCKVEAIQKASAPKSVQELRSFLGLLIMADSSPTWHPFCIPSMSYCGEILSGNCLRNVTRLSS